MPLRSCLLIVSGNEIGDETTPTRHFLCVEIVSVLQVCYDRSAPHCIASAIRTDAVRSIMQCGVDREIIGDKVIDIAYVERVGEFGPVA
jgi:hypothetical protein